jgi:predicted phage-related endonuclease
VDRFIQMPDGKRGLLECKTAHYDMQFKWANGAVPRHYELQVKHYMAVMNIDVAYIACLFSNNENDFVWRKIERDLDEEETTIMQLEHFWADYVLKREEPPLAEKPDMVLDMLRRYYGPADPSESEVFLDASFMPSLEQILALKREKQSADAEVRRLDSQIKSLYAPIVDRLGTACKGLCEDAHGNRITVTFNPTYRTGISKDNLSKLKAQYPDVYDDFVDTTESRIFKVIKSSNV